MASITSLAAEVYEELGSPETISECSIESWMNANLGVLNNKLGTSYVLDTTASFNPEIDDQSAVMLKMIYLHYYFGLQVNLLLGAAGLGYSILEATADGGTIRMANKTELVKMYRELMKDLREAMVSFANHYRFRHQTPQTIINEDGGDDYISIINRPSYQSYLRRLI